MTQLARRAALAFALLSCVASAYIDLGHHKKKHEYTLEEFDLHKKHGDHFHLLQHVDHPELHKHLEAHREKTGQPPPPPHVPATQEEYEAFIAEHHEKHTQREIEEEERRIQWEKDNSLRAHWHHAVFTWRSGVVGWIFLILGGIGVSTGCIKARSHKSKRYYNDDRSNGPFSRGRARSPD